MPQIIEHIDAIARKKQRGVLLIKFHPEDMGIAMFEYDHNKDRRRRKVLAWLDKNNIPWEMLSRLSRKWTFRPLDLMVTQLPLKV